MGDTFRGVGNGFKGDEKFMIGLKEIFANEKEKSHFQQVRDFQLAFEQPVRTEIKPLSKDELAFRLSFLLEEVREFAEASYDGSLISKILIDQLKYCENLIKRIPENEIDQDVVKQFDALLDLEYVADGTYLYLGIDEEKYNKGFNEVHSSNMSKLDENRKVIKNESGKVMKSDRYFKPNLKSIIEGECEVITNE